ncbi:MAG: carboxypeptidase regulatory-like domain-containing protein [Deltaproteobacteria bacterium]|nr:carboxypeptidase regulatory-like domain-containing protein [Deltaproteobacteria bacterium]MDQ3300459.1 carboxypeptidase-like regulatory domain-containing protein [Myxococcota bacterium]
MRFLILLAFLVGCGSTSTSAKRARPTTGGIAGLAHDHDSRDPVAKAQIRVRASEHAPPRTTLSSDRGLYDIQLLAPGRYTVTALFAGQPIEIRNVEVRAGEITMVDLMFTLGRPEPIRLDYDAPAGSEIDRYRPRHLTGAVALIEGTVNDTTTRQRVPGAVVTAVHGDDIASTQQTVSDEQGRYRFEALRPGVYSISAYYSISGRGQIEVRRSGITVDAAEAVVVPLWIEMTR